MHSVDRAKWAQKQPANFAPCGACLAKQNHIMKVHLLVDRIRGEFREMPGLQLTLAQAQRLFGLDPTACRQVIEMLVDASFLRWTASGTIVQAGD